MQLKKMPVGELNPAPYNPRLQLKPGDVAWKKLERSLREFELVQPIVWNEQTGHVVSGHQRLAVLKHQGHTEIDCVVVRLPLEKEKALNVALNNSSVGSDWDTEKLIDLVVELQALPDFDATLTGFDERQLQDLVLVPDPDPFEEPSQTDGDDHLYHATLEIPADAWDAVEEQLNLLLAAHPGIRLHVRSPIRS